MGPLAAVVLSMLLAVQEVPGRLARGLIEQLHSDRIERREAAARSLVALGAGILPQLEEATRSRDVEVASRARSVLAAVEEVFHRETFRKLENVVNQARTLTLRFVSEYRRKGVSGKTRHGPAGPILEDGGEVRE